MGNILKALGGFDQIIKFVLYAIAAIVIYMTIKKLWQAYNRRNAGLQNVNGAQLDPNKNYDSYALAVHSAFDNFTNSADDMENVATTLLPLNNDELKQVNNSYVKLYGKGERTLYEALNDYWLCYPCTDLNAIKERVKSLGIL